MPSPNKRAWVLAAGLLASCGTPDRPRGAGRARPVSDMPVKIGAPYRAGGRIWVPADDRGYDQVGQASWYGGRHRGLPTANGERFDPDGISAAHTTLPLPSYVEVTALATGRTILARVNDRGPFASGRIIDLSQGAARLLGIEQAGVARVRVRRVYPAEGDRAALRAGRRAGERPTVAGPALAALGRRVPVAIPPVIPKAAMGSGIDPAMAGRRGATDTPPSRTPSPMIAPVATSPSTPAGGAGRTMLDLGGFDDPDRADGFASAASGIGPTAVIGIGSAWRVRIGPLDDAAARSALARAEAAGYHDATLVRESARLQDR